MNIQKKDTGSELFADKSISSTVGTVASTLYARILSEQYPVDSRLPAERSLATELGVARNTIREALDLLESRDIISRRPGSGSFVTMRPDADADIGKEGGSLEHLVSSATSPLELHVMRSIIEPEMIRLAIVNMPPRDIEKLGQTLSKMESIHTDAGKYVRLEETFHRQLAEGTGNPLLVACYELVIEARRQNFRSAQQKRHYSPRRIEESQRRYNSLFNAIALRDIESAVEFIQLHLVDEQRLLLQED